MLATAALNEPSLNVLVPNEDNYTVLLMQPHGQIQASGAGVQNRNRALARRQFGQFLADARQTQADLAITPEYSMPWETLVATIKDGAAPAQGKLWVLGCESITYSELEALKHDLAPTATVLYERLQPEAGRFIDPLAYVFFAPPTNGDAAKLVVLVQFKTHPMGDNGHFEINGMQRGTHVYQFGGTAISPIRLVSLICADAFAFTDAHAEAIYDRALIVHIQLNQKPRDEQFRRYRAKLLSLSGDATEVICLNWARNVNLWHGEQATPWNNIGGSAWYLKPNKFDHNDATLCANHRRGLYYTWLKPLQSHALFFNYEPATYQLVATKVAHIRVPAVIARRRGPQLTKTCVWNDTTTAWDEQLTADDGFSAIVSESGQAKDEIKRIADGNPLEAERVLALCAGKIGHEEDWHGVCRLDSCVIDASEVIRRITFCQDTDAEARNFRVARLKRCGNLWDILKTDAQLPPALADLKGGFRLEWSRAFPHQNAISATDQRATVIYMGEESSASQIEATAITIAENLRRAFPDPDQNLLARQRLAVWFRENQQIALFDHLRYVKIDQTSSTSEVDIGREI